MHELKKILLETPLFVVDNEYLDKYVRLVYNNKNTVKEQFHHQIHHIVPMYYYRFVSKPVDNSKTNKVVLSHSDHVLAHYYLAKCSCSEEFSMCNVSAIRIIFENPSWNIDQTEEQLLKELCSYEQTQKMLNAFKSKTYTGTRFIHKDNSEKRVHLQELSDYLSDGWIIGRSHASKLAISLGSIGKSGTMTGKKMPEEGKLKISNAHKGGKYVHKNGVVKHISEEDLMSYISEGWELGNPNARKRGTKCWVVSHEGVARLINITELDEYLSRGFVSGRHLS